MARMTPSEALVETLVAEEVKVVFGIVGSAYMDALDLFPAAGIRFVSVAHEQAAAHAADGLARVTGKPQVCNAQNGPGAANFVSAITAAYWAHSPVVAVTPETGSGGIGTGGFQELDQMPWFQACTKYQVRVNRPERMAELARRCFYIAKAECGPTQLLSRATDETGYVQPTVEELIAARGSSSLYHNNGIKIWQVAQDGAVGAPNA